MIRWALSLLLLFAFSAPSHADFASLLADKHWQNAEETDPLLNTPVCRAFTQVSDNSEPVELSLAYPKDGKSLPMLTLRTRLAAPLVTLKFSSRESEPLFLLQPASGPESQNVYWYAPVNFAHLEQFIRAKLSLEIYFGDVPVKISLSGSSNSVGDAKKCLGSVKVPTDFFKLLNQKKAELTPDLGDRTAQVMWRSTEEAFQAYLAGQSIDEALAVVRKPYASMLRKETSAKKAFDSANASHEKASQQLADARQKVSSIEQSIADGKAKLAALEEEKPKAEADLAVKKAAYLPLKEQMKPYDDKVAGAEKSVKNTSSAIRSNEYTISHNRSEINDLNDERDRLNRSISGLESDVDRYRREYSDAESDYDRYDPESEKRKILDSDFSYRWARDDLQKAHREYEAAANEKRQLDSQQAQNRAALARCKSQPNANCSAEQSAVDATDRAQDQAKNKMSRAQSAISSAEWSIRNAESSAESKVRSEQDRLRSERDDWASKLQGAQNDLDNTHSRISWIDNEIPDLRAEIRHAENALPGLKEKLTQSQAALEQAKTEREAFSQQIGFGAAEQAYEAADAHLDEVVKGIATAKKEIPALEKSLVKAQKEVPSLERSETRRKAELDKANAALQAIEQQLEPLHQQEAPLLADRQNEQDRFETNRAAYQDLYQYLVENSH
jgi:chromosome segregation ATPase